MRKYLVGGNWKCSGDLKFVKEFPATVLNNIKYDPKKVEIVVAPVALHLAAAKENIKNGIHVSAQNLSKFNDGAYTGEISARQVADFGLDWTILGHSERRHIYGETSGDVAEKCVRALEHNINIIACIGEKIEEREAGNTFKVCEEQLSAIREKVDDWSKIVIAYEPVWAIGTGLTATPEQA